MYVFFLKMFIYTLITSFAIAKLEIQIEGEFGWAEKLPTWRLKNWVTNLFGQSHITGYHTWLTVSIFLLSHMGFVIGLPWSVSTELMLTAFFLIGTIIEDYLWFILNPHYGWDKFSAYHINWHKWAWEKIPMMYINCACIALVLIAISFLVKF